MGFEVKIFDEGDLRKTRIEGEMTIYNASALKDALAGAGAGDRAIDLDLSGVTAFDSSGLQLVLALKLSCERNGATLRVTALSEPVETVLSLFDLKYCLS